MLPLVATQPLLEDWLEEDIEDEPHETLEDPGFRMLIVEHPDGSTTYQKIPLTPEGFLHPQEGDRLPNSSFHDEVASTARDMLARRYAHDPTVLVFRDVLIVWEDPKLPFPSHCPDTCVVFGVRKKHAHRPSFYVAQEGVRPTFVFEVVSPGYRKEDRKAKVIEYAQAGVAEYVLVDYVIRRRSIVATELLGYRLVGATYQRIVPDAAGRVWCATLGLWMSMEGERLVMEDGVTGERLRTAAEEQADRLVAEQRAEQERQRAEQERQRAEQERQRADDLAARLAAMEEELRRLRE